MPRIRLAVAGMVALATITMAAGGATAGPRHASDSRPHTAAPGFLLAGGRYTSFDVPRAPIILPFDINNRGQIVGITAADTAAAATAARGFLLRDAVKGPFTPLDVPRRVRHLRRRPQRPRPDRRRLPGSPTT
jgi:hypothetical protein